jgi:glucose-6-phosphate 1-dehydrogenase
MSNKKNSGIPTIFVVLGATGDLMTKKIVPALFNLHEKKELPSRFELVGVSRRDWTDADFKEHVKTILGVKAPNASRASIDSFLKLTTYHKISFETPENYVALGEKLKKIDDKWSICTNKLFYLSVPPQFYDVIFENLHKSHLTDPCSAEEGWTRIVVEKPFGSDEKSAKALDARLAKLFKEIQIYRIDHYLAKEMLQNILAFRFGNNLFEGEWDRKLIEKIDIRLFESIGVEDRGGFYDTVGTLRDVGQNHFLQMLALVTMEQPENYDADAIRRVRAALLETLRVPTVKEAAATSFRAQYAGYRSIKGVAASSETETYFRIRGFLDNPRWEGVPIVMEGGKRMGAPQKEIEITLRHKTPSLVAHQEHERNRIVMRLEPTEGISVTFYAKKAGYALALEERKFTFNFREAGGSRAQYTEEYEKLILDCIMGDQTLFVSSQEIAAMWRFIDPFVTAWKRGLTPLEHYAPDSPAIAAEAAVLDTLRRSSGDLRKVSKEIGIIGLGKMGANLVRQLHEKGWRVVAYNRNTEKVSEIETEGIEGARSIDELLKKLPSPKIIWLMVTAGKPVDDFLFAKDGIVSKLKKGDVVIDGGNSFFQDTVRRSKLLAKKGIKFLDAGVSGGPSGARNGACVMVGGDVKTFLALEQLFAEISVPGGYAHFGSAGAGHFVKMVHNGIEYGMMQSIAEGFALMKKSPFKLDLEKVARLYNNGSVIESRLIGWLESGFKKFGTELKDVSGSVAYTGEGEWTVKTGKKWKMKLPTIEDSFKFRVRSKKSPSYMGKILSTLRNQFGGHASK